jgi:hypothetical protein
MQDDGRRGAASGIVEGLSRAVNHLVRAEMGLAKVEMTGKATEMGKDVGRLAAGGAVAYAGAFVLLQSLVRMLEAVLPRWLAAFVVGAVTTGGGAYVVRQELQRLKEADLTPHQAIDALSMLRE